MGKEEMNSVTHFKSDDKRLTGSYKQEHEDLLALKSKVEQCRKLHSIQGQDGNFNVDGYMCGMFNGMELMLAVLEGREPVFRAIIPREVDKSSDEKLRRLESEINVNETKKKVRTISGTVHRL